jgi:hypothetical protein
MTGAGSSVVVGMLFSTAGSGRHQGTFVILGVSVEATQGVSG